MSVGSRSLKISREKTVQDNELSSYAGRKQEGSQALVDNMKSPSDGMNDEALDYCT